MRSITQRKNKKPIILLSSAAIILVGGGLAYLAIARPFNNQSPAGIETRPANNVDYGPPSQEELQAAGKQKDEIIKSATGDQASNSDADITASIARAAQSGPGQPLNIRVQINGTTSGTCQMTLTKSGQPTISKTFKVALEATSSRCLDSDIPANEFSEGGQWQLRVVVTGASNQTTSVEQTVTVEK